MKSRPWGLYAIALAVLVVGLVTLGVPASTLVVAALALACPLMMMFMMSGMHGRCGGANQNAERHAASDMRDQQPTTGRR